MASTTHKVLTPTYLGAVITASTLVASSETITISPTTAQSSLDFNTLMIRISAVGGSVTPTISATTEFSDAGQSTQALTTIASSGSIILGGQFFEGSRFKSSGGSLIITMAGTGTASIEAYQKPHANE